MEWQESFNIGIDVIDHQHRQILDYINRLEEIRVSGHRSKIQEVGEDKTGLITSNIANLVKNADKLFDIEGTILRRAINYVRKNNPEISDDIEVSLEEDFGLTLKDIDEKEDLYHQQTPEGGAAGPGESTTGGGGGA